VKVGRVGFVTGALLGVLIAGAAAVGAFDLHGTTAVQWDGWPIRSVRVGGQLDHVSRAELEGAVGPHLSAGFLGVDVGSVAHDAQRLPWVASVSVRRVWPDSLHIAVIERKAVARWRSDGLVAANGTVFRPEETGPVEHLPRLTGPDGSAADLLETLRRADELLDGVGRGVVELSVSEHGIWRIRCKTGLEVVLREPQFSALGELARIYEPLLGERSASVAAIDLRYTNGFAVRWKADGEANAESAQVNGKRKAG